MYRDGFLAWWFSPRRTCRPLNRLQSAGVSALLASRRWLRLRRRGASATIAAVKVRRPRPGRSARAAPGRGGRVSGEVGDASPAAAAAPRAPTRGRTRPWAAAAPRPADELPPRSQASVDRGLLPRAKLAILREVTARYDVSFDFGDEAADLSEAGGRCAIEIDVVRGAKRHAVPLRPARTVSLVAEAYPRGAPRRRRDPSDDDRLRRLFAALARAGAVLFGPNMLARSFSAQDVDVRGRPDPTGSRAAQVEHGDDPNKVRAGLQVPSGCGSSVCIDFPAREDADPEAVASFRRDLKAFLEVHVEPHLQDLPHFQLCRVVRVLPPQEDETDGTKRPSSRRGQKSPAKGKRPVSPQKKDDEELEAETVRLQFLFKAESNVSRRRAREPNEAKAAPSREMPFSLSAGGFLDKCRRQFLANVRGTRPGPRGYRRGYIQDASAVGS